MAGATVFVWFFAYGRDDNIIALQGGEGEGREFLLKLPCNLIFLFVSDQSSPISSGCS